MMNKNYDFGTRMIAEGISVSNNTRETGLNNNDLIIGGTGSGKTGGYIFKMLLNPHGSMILSDTKGLLCRMFKGYLEHKGYKVRVLDFVRPDRSIPYNPLSYIRRTNDGGYYEKDVKKIASILVPELDQKEPFWEKAAVRYICVLISYVLEALPESEQTMNSVVRINQEVLGGDGKELLNEWKVEHPDGFCARKYKEIAGTEAAEKMWRSIVEFANEALDPFSYKEFSPIFSNADDLCIDGVSKEKTVLFVNSSDSDKAFRSLSTLFFAQAMQALLETADNNFDGRLDIPVRLILDDFAAGPVIDDFDNLISIIRSREISVSIIVQSISQLSEKYSMGAEKTIINNCDHILYLSGHDYETADFISQYLDRTSSAVLAKSRKDSVLITDGEKPRIVRKIVPYPEDEMAMVLSYGAGKPDYTSPKAEEITNDLNEQIAKLGQLMENEEENEEALTWIDTRTPEDLYECTLNDIELWAWRESMGYVNYD